MSAQYPGNPSLSPQIKQRVIETFRHTVDSYMKGSMDDVVTGCEFLLKMDPLFDPAKKLLEKARNPAAPVDVGKLMRSIGEPEPQVTEADEAAPFVQQFVTKGQAALKAGDRDAARTSLEKAKALDAQNPAVLELEKALSTSPGARPAARAGTEQPRPPKQPEPEQKFDFSGDSSSFVLDSKPASGGGKSAPASDFGFTFEEEPGGGIAGFNPSGEQAEPPPPQQEVMAEAEASAANTFDFTTAPVELSPEDQQKIDSYLAQGDAALAKGDLSEAIDLWSRIFLIDVTHEGASQRIEKARAKKMDVELKTDELMAAGLAALERGNQAAARKSFEEVLKIDASNPAAREQLQLLGEGAAAAPAMQAPSAPKPPAAKPASPVPPPAAPPPPPADDSFSLDDELQGDVEPGSILVPPEPPAAPAKRAPREEPLEDAPAKPARRFPLLLVLGVLILGAAGWFVWSTFLSGGGDEPPPVTTGGAEGSVLARARALADGGDIDRAMRMLAAVPPTDPEHEQALALLDELKQTRAAGSGMIDGRPAREVFAELVEQGREAAAGNDFVAAKDAFERAAAIMPLPADAQQIYQRTRAQLAEIETAVNLFRAGNYREAASNLRTVLDREPANQGARQLLADTHFNLGAQALKENRLSDAMAEFDRALELNPQDEMALRGRELAERYETQPRDLLFRIFVKYLQLR